MAVALEDGRKLIAHELEGVQMSPEREGQWQALLTRPETGAEQIEAALSVFLSGQERALADMARQKKEKEQAERALEEKLRQAEETNRQLDLLEKERAGLSPSAFRKGRAGGAGKEALPCAEGGKGGSGLAEFSGEKKGAGRGTFAAEGEKREAFASAEKGPCRRFGSGGRTEAA